MPSARSHKAPAKARTQAGSAAKVAVIGVGLRLPGAESLDGFWEHLAAGRSLISEVPAERWSAEDLKGDPARGQKTASVWGGFVEGADRFDAAFFGISPREAAWMDPQQRFALETTWHAIEDAGYRPSALAGSRTGVFMGVCHWDYAELLEKRLAQVDAYTPTGIAFSIVANRVSHFFDFKGPSVTNDTACAASMTALADAVRALRDGTCDLAVAGGVNLIWSPNHFVAFSKAGMLSKSGRSQAFDEAADGYVRGEGAATLLLKPLDKALADGDPIHAVIAGIGTNHGGRTNSLTVTNPDAQAELIAEVMRQAGVAPDGIDYVEAHGPGTPLGDPIEIAGLKQAFAARAAETGADPAAGTCGIGSVKTNVGHLEGAAGVAGIVKILAALRHGTLPPNVGFETLNRLADLEGTPFRIQAEATPWKPRKGRTRRACVSSFGFGGSNAHALLEEPPRPAAGRAGKRRSGPAVMPLSARTPAALQSLCAALLAFVEGADPKTLRLDDLAYTLQTGREALAARHAFVAHDLDGLTALLRRSLADGVEADAVSAADDEAQDTAALAAARRWAAGEDLDWPAEGLAQGRRIHAPLTPFDRQRHWMDLSLDAKDPRPVPHPLVHENVSGFGACAFRARLTQDSFVLGDHRVAGESVLPGVACLEMARAATALADGRDLGAYTLENLLWARALAPATDAALDIEIGLDRPDPESVRFAVRPKGKGDEPAAAHAQGTLRLAASEAAEPVALEALRARMPEAVQPALCYARLHEAGVAHGPAFRALASVQRGRGEVLARLKLPRRLVASLEAMPLHPVMLDAAIQAWIGVLDAAPDSAAVPFACERIEVHGPCTATMWAHVRVTRGLEPDARTRTLDIDLLDDAGRQLVAMRGLTLRAFAAPAETGEAAAQSEPTAPALLAPGTWQPAPAEHSASTETRRIRLLLVGSASEPAASLRAAGWEVDVLPVEPGAAPHESAASLLNGGHRIVRGLLQDGVAKPTLLLALADKSVPAEAAAPLAGLFRTAATENPKFAGRLVRLAGPASPDRLAALAASEARAADTFAEVRYDGDDTRQAWRLVEAPTPSGVPLPKFDPEGVTWIVGGLGGLGRIFARWAVARGARKLVLSGRSATPDADTAATVRDLEAAGATVDVMACDATDAAAVARTAAWIAAERGPLKAVVHAAGLLDDGYILTRDAEDASAVFAVKAAGAANLDGATRDCPLDLFLLCSSVAAVFGNPGQAVYGAANAALDAFAERRAAEVEAGQARGRTVAVAWPLWAEGGMTVDAATLQAMQRRFGTLPLSTDAGLAALDRALAEPLGPRVTVLHGETARLRALLAGYGVPAQAPHSPARDPATKAGGALDGVELEERTVAWLRDILGEVLGLEAGDIRADRKLEEYGLDSIAIVETTTRLEEALGPLSKTLFFEYVDVRGVAGHLAAEHGDALQAQFADEAAAPVAPAPEAPRAQPAAAAPPERASERPAPEPTARGRDDLHDIAIVGVSLHVSKADDLEAFWEMLAAGIHGFEPVPAARWDNAALHHPERDVLGKTVVKTGCFLPDIDAFDPRYFRISQAEAELMAPEVRLFLQASVEAFEDAGYSRETLARRYDREVAVIVGSMTNEYDYWGFQNMLVRGSLASGSYTGTLPNMVSYYYGFTGPSYFLDTMCSASATCVHEAVHMLRAGRCGMALAGGVSLLTHPQKLIATSQEHFTSKTAEVIRGYGLGADGTILGEGVGALVLKPLVDAERDGDHVYGVIRGTAISNAGVRNGFTVPSPAQQAVAIERALDDAGIDATSIGYVEGHGSGTALGDPIEVKALTQVFRKSTDAVQVCPLGTVKSNVAHLLGASGLAGIVKVLAQLRHGQLAPSLHAEELNPDIPFETSPFYVQRTLAPWPRLRDEEGRELPRRAGVTSIGAGGMNSHIVIEEAPARPRGPEPAGPDLLVFSAQNPERLRAVLERFAAFLRRTPARFADVAHTLRVGKNELTCRLAVVAEDAGAALAAVEAFLASGTPGHGTPGHGTPGHGTPGHGAVYTPSILDRDPPRDRAALEADCLARRLDKLAEAWCAGAAVDWALLDRGRDVRRVPLPAYPFERVRCWYPDATDAPSVIDPLAFAQKLHPFVGRNLSDAHGLRYRTEIRADELRDYVFTQAGHQAIVPTVAPEIALAVAALSGIAARPGIRDLRIAAAPDWTTVTAIEIAVEPDGAAGGTVAVRTFGADGASADWCGARIAEAAEAPGRALDIVAETAGAGKALERAEIYAALAARDLAFGPYLETLGRLWRRADGGLICALRENPPQQDRFKRNVAWDSPALAAAHQLLILAQPGAAAPIAATGRARHTGGAVAFVACLPGPAGAWRLLFLDGDGREVAAIEDIVLAGAQDVDAQAEATVATAEARQAAPQAAPQAALVRDLQARAAAILKFAAGALSPRESFHDLGFDSITLARYAEDLSRAYGIALSPAVFFEVAHLESLAEHLAARHSLSGMAPAAPPAPAWPPLAPARPDAGLIRDLRDRAAAILKFAADDLSPRESFQDLGFDSITLARYAEDLSRAYGIALSPAIFFEVAHLEALAGHLADRHGVSAGPAAPVAAPLRAAAPAVQAGRPAEIDRRIAIVGMAGRFPGSPDVESFFDNLEEGRDLTGPLPLQRYSPAYAGRMRSAGLPARGGFLDDIDRFDAAFFKVSPSEAERMDPQQRLLLETAWRALEDAGYPPEDLPRETGVFVGVTALDYADLWRAEGLPADGYVATGNSLAMVANRLSHRLDLRGPSEAIDTACSSSLVALLRARDALLHERVEAALVGGVNLCLSLEGFQGPAQAGMLSPGGRCHAFGAEADGYARGEGVAVLMLKRLADAERDGDRILAVLAGGAENHGGRAGALTAPNSKAQADLIVAAMQGIDPASLDYVEAHGTGTSLGDPVEVNGIARAWETLLGAGHGRRVALGTVKSNIGHLEAAAGLAGVVKVAMAMRRGLLPPSLHCAQPNPHIDFDAAPVRLVTEREAWPAKPDGTPRRAGVSSFGFGGTNAHAVLESYEAKSGLARAPLPPHPFRDTRFWLPTVVRADAAPAVRLFVPAWTPAAPAPAAGAKARLAIGAGIPVAESGGARVATLPARTPVTAEAYGAAAGALLEILRRELAAPAPAHRIVQLAVPASGPAALFRGLAGVLRTAGEEDPALTVQIVEMPPDTPAATAAAWLAEEAGAGPGTVRRDADGSRRRQGWRTLEAAGPKHAWRPDGVYLITGGLGGLGRLVAEDIARTAPGAVLVLVGSRALDGDREATLQRLRALGAVAAYREVDVSDAAAVRRLVDHTVEVHGRLTGAIHCAGVLRDRLIPALGLADLQAALAPKVAGTLALHQACAGRGVEIFACFSSLAASLGNAGQAAYAAANGFLDALAEAAPDGPPIATLDWALWRDGGMRIDSQTEQALYERMGQRPLASDDGLTALRRVLAAGVPRAAVIAGDPARIDTFFDATETVAAPAPESPVAPVVASAPATLRAEVRAKLARVFAGIAGLADTAIDPQAPLEDYGIDSLTITKLDRALGDAFERLPKTLFFRHRTLSAVADFLLQSQPSACARWTGVEPAAERDVPTPPLAAPAPAVRAGAADEPIAIVGMSGRYPDAPDLEAFWRNLRDGHDAVREIPAERWDHEAVFEPDPDAAAAGGKSYARWGAFLEGFAEFDPLFFKLSPRDAAAMDPQERLFLQAAWAAVEDAGYTRARLKRVAGEEHGGARVGVFAGITKTGYALHGPFRTADGATVRPTTSFASVANRVSYALGLSGPSVPVDTMCSASLTAIHEACQHLRSGSCAMAIAGGVNLYLHPATYVELSAARMLSPGGRCRAFGAGADGFVPGEGVGCLVLKPLSKALADGDRIHALIRGSAVNHGARTNGYTVPNPEAQRDVVRAALAQAGVAAEAVGYIEAHGTGTDLGDPIEVDGLAEAFRADTDRTGFCALGSVKSGIGHLEAAAGIAGVTKVVLQMKHRTLAPTLHAEPANPKIDFAGTAFVLQHRAAPWETHGRRIAGVSSFGAGGANAHVVLEEWPEDRTDASRLAAADGPELLPLSARDPERLRETAERLRDALRAQAAQADAASAPDEASSEALDAVRRKLAGVLGVEMADIAAGDAFDALGLDASHLHALTRWVEEAYGARLTASEIDGAGSPAALAALVGGSQTVVAPLGSGLRLADVAHTLRVGREAMACRLAIVARTVEEAVAALDAWLAGRAPAIPVYGGEAGAGGSALSSLADDEAVAEIVAQAWSGGRVETVARLWAEGLDVPWLDLPTRAGAQIVSLPTYPFARERFWIPTQRADAAPSDDPLAGVRHAVETAAGDPRLEADLAAFERAVGRVLQAVFATVDHAAIAPGFRAWAAAVPRLLAGFASGLSVSIETAFAAWTADPAVRRFPAQAALAEAALRALPEILADRRRATDVLFPEGRQNLVEAVYKENPVAVRFSATAAEAVAAAVRARSSESGGVRILEIGAGTGGTSEPVFAALERLGAPVAEYAYTDVSKAFLIHAERAYGARMPALRTALFDVEKPLAGQDVPAGRYDVVVAANVLHATADIAQTLARVAETLAPGGVLVLNETNAPTAFTHVTFGLLDGWWRFRDPERRIPGSPSLTAEGWQAALSEAGFAWVAGSTGRERALGQQVVVARLERPAHRPKDLQTAARAATPDPAGMPLAEAVLAALGETLNMGPAAIDRGKSFADYGLDSILGAEFVHRVRGTLGVGLQHTALFDFANVDALVRHLETLAPPRPAPAEAAAPTVAPEPKAEVPARGPEPIAIVGASGRFAKSPTVDALWAHLAAGHDLVEPATRFDLAAAYPGVAPETYGRHGSFLDGIDRFDPVFFGISGHEATYMDPQQRLFLEEAWKTLEVAGHAGEDIVGARCGVFVGCAHGDYQELFAEQPPGQAFWGNTTSLIPSRISYWLDLKGPAVAVDTACSSSLVALHLACRSIRNGECDMALAGGVFVQCSPRFFRYANAAQMLSASGRCAAFGAGADGIVPGEAVAAVLLRPLADALADGDTILGLVVGSGTNQDGTTNGITAPSAASQERLIRSVHQEFGIDPASIDVVEAHGTGTPLGDPIEHAALARVFAEAGQSIALGSIKSNIGHATTAAGIAGLVKVLWSLKHEAVPPTLHLDGGNPAIDFADSPLQPNAETQPWPRRAGRPRRAGLSSFGFGGTNAHAVIEEAPETVSTPEPAATHLFALSARSDAQLRALAEALARHVEQAPGTLAEDVAFTLLAGRRRFRHRLAVVADGLDTLARTLRAWLAGEETAAVAGVAPEGAAASVSGAAVPEDDGDARTAALLALARAFATGAEVSHRALFHGPRRRVPLPTHPLAGQSYWVGTKPSEMPEAAPAAAVAPPPPAAVRERAPAAPGRVKLAAPAAMLAHSAAAPGAAKVTLPALGGSPERIAASSPVEGVRLLALTGHWDAALASALAAALDTAEADERVRALVLEGDTAWHGRAVPGFAAERVLQCRVPVVAAVRAGGSGQGAAVALLSDFAILASGTEVAAIAVPADPLAARAVDARLAALAAGPAGGLRRVAAADVVETAVTLAREIAEAPREALVLLKRHMRQDLPARFFAPLPVSATPDIPASAPPAAAAPVALATDVMRLELRDDGVAILTMLERAGRNTFTPAFMDGMEEAFAKVPGMPEAKVLVLTGHDGVFACGGTAEGLTDLTAGGSRFTDRRIYALPLDCPIPVVAAMAGHAIGAGWTLGAYCDHAVAADEAVHHANYLWYGFTPGAGSTLMLPLRLGEELGREALFSARAYRGRELAARAPGLTVRPTTDVFATALALASDLAAQPRQALVADKAARTEALRERLEAVLALELAMHETTLVGNERVRARIREKFADSGSAIASSAAVPAPPQARPAALEELVGSLAETLAIDAGEIAESASFLELGLDSILAVTWIRSLNARFGIELPATAVYAHPTVGALGRHVASLVGEAAEALPVTAVAPQRAAASEASPAEAEPATAPLSGDTALRTAVMASLAETLMIPEDAVSESASFLDLGLDSILAVTWIRSLNAGFGIDLPATAVYAHPTVGALLDRIAGLVPDGAASAVPSPAQTAPETTAPTADETPVSEPSASKRAEPAPVRHAQAPAPRHPEPIAIVGAAGRFPQAADLEGFWRTLAEGRDCIAEVPPSRWRLDEHYDPDPQAPGKTYCKWMGALDDVDAFDARFFGVLPREAELTDPQQRLFLETAWHAIEDAGLDPGALAGSALGVWVASGPSGYEELISERNTYSLLGSSGSILAARISYLLDLRGPAVSVDTACSSSLVALVQACESLAAGTCDMALAGGACVLIGPKMFVDTAKVGMLSPDGRCFSFDARANGFVPGEGVGAVLLKRLSDAERDGDPIHAVIRGWGVNQDGRTNGITAPNPQSQTALLKSVQARFGIDPASVGYVECHGTGTPLGDPIEVEGLTDAFAGVPEGTRVAIGSVKSNMGHLLAAAGIAGALKAMLAVERGRIPPSINIEEANGHIPFARTPFRIARTLADWPAPADGAPRRAAVNSFGFSGTNAHAVIESYPPRPAAEDAGTPPVFVLSARGSERLTAYAERLERFVTAHPDLDLAALARTLQTGRQGFATRLAFAFESRADLLRKLASVIAGSPADDVHRGEGEAGEPSAAAEAALASWMERRTPEAAATLARLWAAGETVAWPRSPAPRLHLPGYPFARTRHWVEPAPEPAPARPTAVGGPHRAPFAPVPGEGEIGRVALRLHGDEPWLTGRISGGLRRLTGLALAEAARDALERLTGTPVRRLTQLMWGRPVTINGAPRDLAVVVTADAEGLLYRIEAGDDEDALHLGAGPLAGEVEPAPGRLAAATDDRPDATDAFRAFAERLAAHSEPQAPETPRIVSVQGDAGGLGARLVRAADTPAPRGLGFDPLSLDPIWRLVAFAAAGSAGEAALPFPASVEAMTAFAPLGREFTVEVLAPHPAAGRARFAVAVYDADGAECLRIEGLRLAAGEARLSLEAEKESLP